MFLPNNLTKWSAICLPRPVFTNPLEMKNAIAINQMLLLPKPATAVFMSIIPTSTMTVKPIIDTAPIDIGCVIQAMIVATNIANIYHAVGSTASGLKRCKCPNKETYNNREYKLTIFNRVFHVKTSFFLCFIHISL